MAVLRGHTSQKHEHMYSFTTGVLRQAYARSVTEDLLVTWLELARLSWLAVAISSSLKKCQKLLLMLYALQNHAHRGNPMVEDISC